MPLPEAHLRLAIATAIVEKMGLEELEAKLFREDPERVRSIYDQVVSSRTWGTYSLSQFHKRVEAAKKKPLPSRKKIGLRLPDVSKRTRIPLAALVSLLEHHGYLELVPFGLEQKRRLITETAFKAGVGHNVSPDNRIGHLEGFNKASVFPVLYEDTLSDVIWTLDYEGIKKAVRKLSKKKDKLSWLLSHHGYLPDTEIASLSGYSSRGISKAKQRQGLSSMVLITSAGTFDGASNEAHP